MNSYEKLLLEHLDHFDSNVPVSRDLSKSFLEEHLHSYKIRAESPEVEETGDIFSTIAKMVQNWDISTEEIEVFIEKNLDRRSYQRSHISSELLNLDLRIHQISEKFYTNHKELFRFPVRYTDRSLSEEKFSEYLSTLSSDERRRFLKLPAISCDRALKFSDVGLVLEKPNLSLRFIRDNALTNQQKSELFADDKFLILRSILRKLERSCRNLTKFLPFTENFLRLELLERDVD